MNLIDMANWNFPPSESTELMKITGNSKPSAALYFQTAIDLVCYLAAPGNDDEIRIQSLIRDRLNSDPNAKSWKRARTPLRKLKHFPKYRKNESERYHEAARARMLKNASPKQIKMAEGLEAEINASQVIVPAGQVLFHGRADRKITNPKPYPTFISTTLHPVVALNSARRRSGLDQERGPQTIYVLTLGMCLPALWGHTGQSHEYELLLPYQLSIDELSGCQIGDFRIIEATVFSRE